MGKLFGTDGVRGIVGEGLTEDLAYKLGVAAGRFISTKTGGKIVLGRDTRSSGQMLEAAVAAGITTTGSNVLSCGIIPTPAIALLVRELGADGGIVISASHNPPEHNGIKFFDKNSSKLSDELESEIEEFVLNFESAELNTTEGATSEITDATERYIAHSVSTSPIDLSGLTIAIDCGHGASYQASPEAFRRMGAVVHVINDDFTGLDINVNCGSTNLSAIQGLVKKSGADFGIAHDGDADRVLAVDENGDTVDGDFMMAICAKYLQSHKALKNNTVVSTVMANLGFDKAMEKLGIKLIKASVGDRYVLEEMKKNDANFGGEQSGHIVFLDHNSTGDGLVTAIQLAVAIRDSGQKLSELKSIMKQYPQILVNVPVVNKAGLSSNAAIQQAVREAETKLAGNGRILVRPSGTEPLIRVMAEASNIESAQKAVDAIVDVVNIELG